MSHRHTRRHKVGIDELDRQRRESAADDTLEPIELHRNYVDWRALEQEANAIARLIYETAPDPSDRWAWNNRIRACEGREPLTRDEYERGER